MPPRSKADPVAVGDGGEIWGRNEHPPINRLSLSLDLRMAGSTSAPARKVSRIPPNAARKSIQGAGWRPKKFPATTPATISMMAADSAASTETMLAKHTSKATHIAVYVASTGGSRQKEKLLPAAVGVIGLAPERGRSRVNSITLGWIVRKMVDLSVDVVKLR